MGKFIVYVTLLILAGCSGTLAKIKVPENIDKEPIQVMNTEGEYWGFGQKGNFDLAGEYTGRYTRSASSSSWFGETLRTSKGDMLAEVVNTRSKEKWQLICSGEKSNVSIGGVSFGNEQPYVCKILQQGARTGSYRLNNEQGVISIASLRKVVGKIELNNSHFLIESVHKAKGSFIPLENPLGYYVKKGTEVIAAIQINGEISLQHRPLPSNEEKDILVLATVASALSWRPKN